MPLPVPVFSTSNSLSYLHNSFLIPTDPASGWSDRRRAFNRTWYKNQYSSHGQVIWPDNFVWATLAKL